MGAIEFIVIDMVICAITLAAGIGMANLFTYLLMPKKKQSQN